MQRKGGRISSQQQLGVVRQELQIQTGIKFLRDDGNHSENVLTQLGVAGNSYLA